MNDEAKLYYSFSTSKEMNDFRKRNEFEFLPNRRGGYNGVLRNLFLSVYPNSYTLGIGNSIQKFIKGENYSTFTRRECEEALNELEQILKIPLESLVVRKIATGLNIRVNELPETYLPIPISYRGKKFYIIPPQQGKRIVEVICKGAELSNKFYDKSEQFYRTEKIRLKTPFLFRFETVYHKMTPIYKLLNRERISAKELTTEAFMTAIAKNQLATFETINKKMEMDLSNLTPRDFCLLQSFADIPPEAKKKHAESYRKERSRYNRLKKELQFSDSKVNELRTKFKEEADKILSN